MNKFKSICAVMAIVVIMTGLNSCNSEGDQPNEPAVKMQLTGMTITDEEGSLSEFKNFTYDDKGRLTSYDVEEDQTWKETITYSYYDSSIVLKCNSKYSSYTYTYNLTNGIITSMQRSDTKDPYIYSYTSNNLTKMEVKRSDGGRNYIEEYYWEGGNPIRYDDEGYGIQSYIYSDKPCYIGNIQTFFDHHSGVQVELLFGSWEEAFLQQQGYFGNLPKNLVSSALYKGEIWWTLDYELNSNGYPTKITAKEGNDTAVMTLTWK